MDYLLQGRMKKILIFTVSLLCYFVVGAEEVWDSDVFALWSNRDISGLVVNLSHHPENRTDIIDALILLDDQEFEKLSYEQLNTIINYCKNDSVVCPMFIPFQQKRFAELVSDISKQTPKELVQYAKKYPTLASDVYNLLGSAIVANKKNIKLQELLYLQYQFPTLMEKEVEKEVKTRNKELQNILWFNANKYFAAEKEQSELLLYVLERKVYSYLYLKYSLICYEYAQIGDVPNDVNSIEREFDKIVKKNIRSNELMNYLQLEADAYCDVINQTRKGYCVSAGIPKYVQLDVSVPPLSFKYFSDRDLLAKIPQARKDYLENREDASTVADVAGFFFGSFAKLVVNGVGDYLVADNLADKIINARLLYVDEVFNSMHEYIEKEVDTMIMDVITQISNNERSYVESIYNEVR